MRSHGGRQRIGVVALLLVCISLIALDYGGRLRGVHRATGDAFAPVEDGFHSVVDPIGTFFSGLPDVNRNKNRAIELQRENTRLHRQLNSTGLSKQRVAQLAAIGALADGKGFAIHTATVLDYGPSLGFEWTIRISVGSRAKVAPGMSVVSAAGLVGRVKEVSRTSSLVVLAIDPGSSVGVRIERSGELGVVTGHGRSSMSFLPLDPNATVKPGDRMVTGPYGGTSYTPGLAVGTVAAVGQQNPVARVQVTPVVDFTALDVVGVVLAKPAATPGTGSGSR